MVGRILLVGGGKMGQALLAGWLAGGLHADKIAVVEPDEGRAGTLRAAHRVQVVGALAELAAGLAPEVVVIAVKPQDMHRVAPAYRGFVPSGCTFLSIAAGITLGFFERVLGAEAAVVRSMPNLPATVDRAMTVACPNQHVSAAQRERCDELLAAVGEVAWIEDEGLLDAVTGLSGTGPAYVFLLVEAMAKAGEAVGLPPDLSMRLARVTVAGAGETLHWSSEAASVLRENVTSPGGTAAEALKVLMGPDGWQDLVTRAVVAATRRSRELSSG